MLPASAIRQAEFANAAKDFGIKGKKREPISSLMILTGFFNMRKVERFAQRPNKRFIVADSFARAVKSFATGLPLHSTNLITIFRGFTWGYRRSGESQYQN